MRVPVYLVCAALIVAIRSEERPEYYGRFLEPVNMAADQETINYLLPKLAAKYRPNSEWSGVTDPRFYVLTDSESNEINPGVIKRDLRNNQFDNYMGSRSSNQPSLSIKAPIDVLRKTMYDINMQRLIERNRNYLNNLHR